MARTAHKSLVESFARFASNRARSIGYFYAKSRRVTIGDVGPGTVSALVVDTAQDFKVQLIRIAEKVVASCTCMHAREAVCKHIWATIVESDDKGFLRDGETAAPTVLELDELDIVDEVDDDYFDQWESGPTRSESSDRIRIWRDTGGVPAPRPARRVPPAWRQQFDRIRNEFMAVANRRGRDREEWPASRQILYELDLGTLERQSEVTVHLQTRDKKTNGEWAKAKPAKIVERQIMRLPDVDDREILTRLLGARAQTYYYDYYYAVAELGPKYTLPLSIRAPLLQMMCRTGRCYFGSDVAVPLEWDDGDAWTLCLEVVPDEASQFCRVVPKLHRGDVQVPIEAPVRAIMSGLVFIGNRIALLDQEMEKGWPNTLASLRSLKVPIDQGLELVAQLYQFPDCPRVSVPESLHFEEQIAPPQPCLKIFGSERGIATPRNDSLGAALSFDYCGTLVSSDDSRRVIVNVETRVAIRRDFTVETAAYEELRRLRFRPRGAYYWNSEGTPLEIAPKQLPQAVRELTAGGWRVEAEGKLYKRPGEVKIAVSSGIDWFELHGSVSYGETTASLPTLLAALRKGQDVVQLDDGTFGMLPEEWLQKFGVLAGLGTANGDHLRFTRSQVGLLDALLSSQRRRTVTSCSCAPGTG